MSYILFGMIVFFRRRQPHRDYYEIIKLILQTVYTRADGVNSSSEIAYRCELTWNQFIRYRDLLLKQKLLLTVSSNTTPNQHYEITPEGERYLQLFAEIQDDLKPIG
jgi:predicted transcriptional regulator